jgi:hypothetical protein
VIDPDSGGSTLVPQPPKQRRRTSWGQGIPRRRRKTGEPWQIQVIRGMLPLGVVAGFLALGLILAVLAYNATGSETLAVVAGGIGLVMAILFTERVARRLLDYFS